MSPAIIDLTVLFNAFGSGIGLFWSYLLLSRKDSSLPHYFLSSLLFLFTFFMVNTILQLSGYGKILPTYQDFANSFGFLIGPLIFGFILSHTQKNTSWLNRFGAHAIPFSVVLFILLILPAHKFIPGFKVGLIYLWNLQTLTYLLLCFQTLTNCKITNPMPILLLRYFSLIWLLNLILFTVKAFWFPVPDIIFLNITLLFCLIIIMVAMRTFKAAIGTNLQQSPSFKLPKQDYQTFSARLIKLMEAEHLYRNPDLTIQKLANALKISPRYISATLNHYHQKSFYEFVNAYRINEVIRKLQKPESAVYTINGLATQAGFKSTSAFYKAFRDQTGMTPGAFRKQMVKSSN